MSELDNLISQLTENLNANKNTYQTEKLEDLSFGLPNFDESVKVPRGGITQIFGEYSSGKSSLSLQLIKATQQNNPNSICIYVDTKNSFDLAHEMKQNKLRLENLIIYQNNVLEDVADFILKMLESDVEIDLIVIDATPLICLCEMELKNSDDTDPALNSRMFKRFLNMISSKLNNTALLINTDIMDNIGSYGKIPIGGHLMKNYIDLIINVSRKGMINYKNNIIGYKYEAHIKKDKKQLEQRKISFEINKYEGVSYLSSLIDVCLKYNVLKKVGNYFYLDVEKLCNGRQALKKLLSDDKKILNTLEQNLKFKQFSL